MIRTLFLLFCLPTAALAAEVCTCTSPSGSCSASIACSGGTASCYCTDSGGCSATCGRALSANVSASLTLAGPPERVLERVAEVLGVALHWEGELPGGEVALSIEASRADELLEALSTALGVRVTARAVR